MISLAPFSSSLCGAKQGHAGISAFAVFFYIVPRTFLSMRRKDKKKGEISIFIFLYNNARGTKLSTKSYYKMIGEE